jgi:hypothetical protein
LSKFSAALIRARCQQVADAPDHYDFANRLHTCEQHSALLRLFARLDAKDENDLLAGALAVYGWMPTMMDTLSSRNELKELIVDLASTESNRIVTTMTQYIGTGALRSVNNSTVGTSKLLHFFLPRKVPIWDSVLAGSFGLVHHYQLAREQCFVEYVQAVHTAAQLEDMPWETMNFADGHGLKASRVRQIEFTLYAFARKTPSQR